LVLVVVTVVDVPVTADAILVADGPTAVCAAAESGPESNC
jgi:hypothetical protein